MPLDRREFLNRSALTGAGAAIAGTGGVVAAPAAEAAGRGSDRTFSFSVLGTTDLHGNVFNWDYFTDAEFDDSKHNDVGLAKIATLVDRVREEKGCGRTLLIDAGDTIQGTQLAYYYARIEPITGKDGKRGPVHPMAQAMNRIGYDAAALGNHEFNYGIPLLRAFEEQCDFPLLGANALDARTQRPAFPPYVIKRVRVPHGRDIKVGILGLTNPGIAIWDKANVQGKMVFPGLVEQARKYVPRLRDAGADVVVVASHSGSDGSSSYGDALPWVENASAQVAEQVPGIDAVLVGHAHVEIPERIVVNKETGRPVVLSEPLKWGQRLTVFDFELERGQGGWQVTSVHSKVLNSNEAEESPAIARMLRDEHAKVVAYVNTRIGTAEEAMSAAEARLKDTPILDFVNYVQAETVKAGLSAGDAALPILSVNAPFSRTASIPAGQVSIRDVAGLYIFDNTLEARKLTGAQLKDYLEYSAKYFSRLAPGAPVDPDALTNAGGTPDYNYDVVWGVSYDIDIAKPVGQRITGLAYRGEPIDPAQQFLVAFNNYRASGGGGFPHVAKAPVAYIGAQEIRQTLIDWVVEHKVIDPNAFASDDWRLTREGAPVF
ncbi:bifunctional metallophosphatase/5'-nucleotidase [Wenjunlia tyrosinilytica]|uniref:Multifunctional 2',3'-cyclic-nucleotide 2'-phosphodiesterase/5'-nucleotidase/3'-nucleotidase n=1 Tax=Wenjunlia tyrosinilytica TaxID=1544741 RepID=A0A917ZEX1_9ACTN|nr:5'-nucleotidase C-terminal domain-containing protein [Wenjunlia tyrosinilytica]GGO81571.1 multifunctional 2',3'-cyclic-nucleotide 2'-phosphodiesterase/5'-nucleotidase/3'-nucleotidase [Wenjunlia tyrosinilytica]